ncbi:phage portal protein [Escherichia coli]
MPSPADVPCLAETGCGIRCYQATRDLDRSSLYTAVYSGPVMPWIDPVKEAGLENPDSWWSGDRSDWVRAGGRNPDDVERRRKAEIDENRKLDLVFDTDPASDKGGSSAATKRQ